MDIFEEVINRGIEYDTHESDLYIPVNVETEKLVKKYNKATDRFISQIDGKLWFDVYFAYSPYWENKQRNNPMRKGCSKKARSGNIADMVAGRKGHRKRSVKQASAIAYKFAREQGCPLPKNYFKSNPAIADHFERLYHLGKAIAFDLVEKIVEPTMEETRNFYYKSIGTLIGSGDIYSELEQEMVLEGFLHALSKDSRD